MSLSSRDWTFWCLTEYQDKIYHRYQWSSANLAPLITSTQLRCKQVLGTTEIFTTHNGHFLLDLLLLRQCTAVSSTTLKTEVVVMQTVRELISGTKGCYFHHCDYILNQKCSDDWPFPDPVKLNGCLLHNVYEKEIPLTFLFICTKDSFDPADSFSLLIS